jgi:hypothetical protein
MLGDRCSQALLRKKREAAKRRPAHLRSLPWSAMPSEWEVYRGCRKFPTNPPLRGLSRLPRRIDEFRGKRRARMHRCRSTTRPSQVSAKEVASDAQKKISRN